MWPSNRVTRGCRMGYQQPMNASDSICVRSRWIQGISIARSGDDIAGEIYLRWFARNRHAYDRQTKMGERGCKKENGRWLGRREEAALSRFRKIESILCGRDRRKWRRRLRAYTGLNCYIEYRKRNGRPVDGETETAEIEWSKCAFYSRIGERERIRFNYLAFISFRST